MACLLRLARFPDQSCPSKYERVYASSPSPFHISINGPSSNYFPNLPLVRVRAQKPRATNRLSMTTSFSIACHPQQRIQAEKDEDDSKQTLIERIGKYIDSLVPGGDLLVESLDEDFGIVDLIQRLGIQRFFQQQRHHFVESFYSKWDEIYRLTHAKLSVLGFRLLRFHGNVTAGGMYLQWKIITTQGCYGKLTSKFN